MLVGPRVEVKAIEGHSLEGHSLGVNVLRFTPDGRMLLSGGKDRTICVWKLQK